MEALKEDILGLLKVLIATPSISQEEDQSARIIASYLENKSIPVHQKGNNLWAMNKRFDVSKPTVLLNSHHDTVKPNAGYIKNPFSPVEENGKIYGLGSNDAGGALVSLIGTFVYLYDHDLPYNLVLLASAEEEISGKNGVELALQQLPDIHCGIVGEPTEMRVAIAERGLMVIDAHINGKAGHVARDEGINALYLAMEDVQTIQHHSFQRISDVLGSVKTTVTVMESGNQHNVVPDFASYVIDVRLNECYTHQEVLAILSNQLHATLQPRSMRLKPSGISQDHPLVLAANILDWELFGSATMSDQALMDFPTIKLGPGKSERSHTADEFIYREEIYSGLEKYIKLLETLNVNGLTQNNKSYETVG